jgi:hypothetical protein
MCSGRSVVTFALGSIRRSSRAAASGFIARTRSANCSTACSDHATGRQSAGSSRQPPSGSVVLIASGRRTPAPTRGTVRARPSRGVACVATSAKVVPNGPRIRAQPAPRGTRCPSGPAARMGVEAAEVVGRPAGQRVVHGRVDSQQDLLARERAATTALACCRRVGSSREAAAFHAIPEADGDAQDRRS